MPSQAPASRREESGASAQTLRGLRPGCSSVAFTSPVSALHTMTEPSEQEAAAGAEAAAVDPVAVTPERRKGKLREVGRGINTERFITGGGRQEGWREGTAGDLICMMSESAN